MAVSIPPFKSNPCEVSAGKRDAYCGAPPTCRFDTRLHALGMASLPQRKRWSVRLSLSKLALKKLRTRISVISTFDLNQPWRVGACNTAQTCFASRVNAVADIAGFSIRFISTRAYSLVTCQFSRSVINPLLKNLAMPRRQRWVTGGHTAGVSFNECTLSSPWVRPSPNNHRGGRCLGRERLNRSKATRTQHGLAIAWDSRLRHSD